VAFTQSEPYGARRWMPSHDQPGDRAEFSIELRLPEGETLVANGDRIFDQHDGATGTHRVHYESGFTLPTYIMAFSAGELDVDSRPGAGTKLSLVHRRGAPKGSNAVDFAETARAIETYESLIGVRYPFHSYSQVFMPGGWGEENATISLLGDEPLDDGVGIIDISG